MEDWVDVLHFCDENGVFSSVDGLRLGCVCKGLKPLRAKYETQASRRAFDEEMKLIDLRGRVPTNLPCPNVGGLLLKTRNKIVDNVRWTDGMIDLIGFINELTEIGRAHV